MAFLQKYLTAGLVAVIALLFAALAIQSLRVASAKTETAKTVAAWNADKAQASAASAKQSEEFRAKETTWNKEREANVRTAQEQSKAHDDAIRAGGAELDRVRAALAAYVARARGASAAPSVASGSSAAGDALDLLSDMYGRADDAAAQLADYADRARIAGQACERAYDGTVN